MATEHVVKSKVTRLTDKYPHAYSDFYGNDTPCVFKTGLEWPMRRDWGIVREPRPVYRHPVEPNWLSIGKLIYDSLDSIGVKWTSINPLAYANAGEAKPFCSFIISIGVQPHSLLYDAAVADVVKKILREVDFPDIEVAFVESVVTRSVATSPKLLSFDPLPSSFPDLRKSFTPALGLSIAPLKYPHFEGTAALYFRLGKDNKRTAVLTCAHVARPPPVYPNTGTMRTDTNQPLQEVVALGNTSYINAVKAMTDTIDDCLSSIKVWDDALDRLGEPIDGENSEDSEGRNEYLELISRAKRKIEKINAIHDEVTRHRDTLDQRVLGFMIHSEKIEVSDVPFDFMNDWALIELYDERIDWPAFKGNKVYVGGNLSISDFGRTMFPVDRAGYQYPRDGLLQAYGVVQDAEIRDPQHLDVHGEKCLLVVKNGSATGTTVGRVNGLESFTRYYDHDGTERTSIEIAVLPYDHAHGKFSDAGDSGSIVLARDGRIVGMLTSSAGSVEETNIRIAYLTPYWWLEQKIKAKFPDYSLYEVVD